MLIPDVVQAELFLDLLDPVGEFTFQCFADNDAATAYPTVLHGTFAGHAAALTDWNQHGAGVFAMVNAGDGVVHPGKKTCRTNENVIRVRAHMLDLDGAPLEPVLAAKAAPHIVVESSPGKWHVYWCVTDCELGDFTTGQKVLAAKFGGDPKVCDLARVMRLPGFFHQKGEPFMSRLLTADSAEKDTK